jgi:hypothetical protein
MQKTLLFCLSLLCSVWGHSQSVGPEVVATAGDHFTGTQAQMSWTLGEPLIMTFSNENAVLTQGFHQTSLTITSLNDLEPDFLVRVFPNPTTASIQVEAPEAKTSFSLELFDLAGKPLRRLPAEAPVEVRTLDLSTYPPGLYLLQLRSEAGKTLKTFKIVKQN